MTVKIQVWVLHLHPENVRCKVVRNVCILLQPCWHSEGMNLTVISAREKKVHTKTDFCGARL